MAFTTLEQRFNQVSTQLYSRYAPSNDQLVRIAPNTNGAVFGSQSRVKSDSRLLPLVSTARDIKRISAFLTSTAGALFIGKQLLLQTGNTFSETRFYNPLSALINTDPFIGRGSARHLDMTQLFNVKRPTRALRGGLQTESVEKLTGTNDNVTLFDRIKAQASSVTSALFNPAKYGTSVISLGLSYYVRPEDRTFYYSPLVLNWRREGNFISYVDSGDPSIEGIRRYGVQTALTRGEIRVPGTEAINPRDTAPKTFRAQFRKFGGQRTDYAIGSKTFKELENTFQTNGYLFGKLLDALNFGPSIDNAEALKERDPETNSIYPTIADPYNGTFGIGGKVTAVNVDGTPVVAQNQRQEVNQPSVIGMYSNIEFDPKNIDAYARISKPDIIKFVFRRAAPDAKPVHFRAFLSSIKENIKPEFNEQRYIGRTERFVTYGGAKRTANFEFNIVAFGQSEVYVVWERINYLTGMTFPVKASNNGFMVPPLFKLTIGGIYEEQPCYIETLDYDFLDNTITFDIEKEVPQVVNVKMNVVLLEKRSKFYDSPFYAITEQREKRLEAINLQRRQAADAASAAPRAEVSGGTPLVSPMGNPIVVGGMPNPFAREGVFLGQTQFSGLGRG